ncbi:MAG: SMC family ATPase [Lewinellaceae bacterium]|nr:SMC family ATPase [Lewinellaceae bacterium]
MILHSLSLQHYKQYGHLELEFQEGLVGIIGKNGAGKSTIFEAILYCLYGKDEINNKELIRSAFVAPKVPVVLRLGLSIGEIRYTIHRELRGKKLDTVVAELYKNDSLVAKGANAVNDEVTRLLQLDRDAFKRSVFSGQKELTELSDTKGEKRAKMVRRMLGLDNLDEIQSQVGSDMRTLRNEISGQQQLLLNPEDFKQHLQAIKTLGSQLKQCQKDLKAARTQQEALQKEFRQKQDAFEIQSQKQKQHHTLAQRQTQLKERLEGAQNRSRQLEQRIENLRLQKSKLASEAGLFKTFQAEQQQLEILEKERQKHLNYEAQKGKIDTLLPSLKQGEARIAALLEELRQVPQLEAGRQQSQAELLHLQQQREQKGQEYQQGNEALATLKERMRERESKIAKLTEIGKEGTCPTCQQPVRDAYDRVLAELQANIREMEGIEHQKLLESQEKLKAEGWQIKAAEEKKQLEVKQLETQLARLQELSRQLLSEQNQLKNLQSQVHSTEVVMKEIGPIHFDPEQYNAISARVKTMLPRYQIYLEENNYIIKELPLASTELEKVKELMAQTSAQANTEQQQLEALKFDEAAYQLAQQAFSSMNEILQTQNGLVQKLLTQNLSLQNEMDRNQEKIANQERILERISGKQAEIELLEKLAELLKQFKLEILERVSPGISREASSLFSRITKGKYENILVDENFEFTIADGGVYYPIERFSGGEIDLANFCLRIAITKAIMELSGAGQAVAFLAFDEIFGSQDEERRHEMMLALHFLQEQFRQIYIVSHIETQKDYFPHILEVKNTEAGSVVRWV